MNTIITEQDLRALSSDVFEHFCHVLLYEKYGSDYQPYDGDGIDGIVTSQQLAFQCYHPVSGEFKWEKVEKDLSAAQEYAMQQKLNEWTLATSADFTSPLRQAKWREVTSTIPFKCKYWDPHRLCALAQKAGIIPAHVQWSASALRNRSALDCNSLDDNLCISTSHVMKLKRHVVDRVVSAIDDGWVLVVGDPGTGKSGAIRQAAERLCTDRDCLVFRLDRLKVDNVHDLGSILGCQSLTPCQVLTAARAVKTQRPILFLDALDALRATRSQGAILEWLQELHSKSDWIVVLSARTFESKHSIRLRQLFPIQISVEALSDAEWRDVLEQSDQLRTASERLSPAVTSGVLRNLFNLRLLCQLIDTVDVLNLERITSEVSLYREFWDEVVRTARGRDDLDSDERHSVALQIVERMATVNSLRLAYSRAAVGVRRNILTDLISDGVLQSDAPPSQVWFFHQTFHDYALALWLDSLADDKLLAEIAKPERLIMLLPALRRLWDIWWGEQIERYWSTWALILELEGHPPTASKPLPAFVRLLPAQVLYEKARSTDDLGPLIAASWGEDAIARAVNDLLQVRKGNLRAGETIARFSRMSDSILVQWARRITVPQQCVLNILNVLKEITDINCGEREQYIAPAMEIAANIYERFAEDQTPWSQERRAVACSLLSRCASADVARAGELLCLEAAHGDYRAASLISHEFAHLAAASPALASSVLLSYFTHPGPAPTPVYGGEPSLTLVGDTSSSYTATLYQLTGDGLGSILSADPVEGIRCASAAIKYVLEQNNDSYRQAIDSISEQLRSTIPAGENVQANPGYQYPLELESSGRKWWFDPYQPTLIGTLGEQVLTTLRTWLAHVDPDEIDAAFAVLREHASACIIWQTCLQSVGANPKPLGSSIHFLLAEPVVWQCDETRGVAFQALLTCWPHFTQEEREACEHAMLDMDAAVDFCVTGCETRERIKMQALLELSDRTDGALVTAAATQIVSLARSAGLSPSPPYSQMEFVDTFTDISQSASAGGAEEALPETALQPYLNSISRSLTQPIDPVEVERIVADAQVIEQRLTGNLDDITLDERLEAHKVLLSLCQTILRNTSVEITSSSYGWAYTHTISSIENTAELDDMGFQPLDSPGWYPSIREEVVKAVLLALTRQPQDTVLTSGLQTLAADAVTGARVQVAKGLAELYRHNQDLAFQIAGCMAQNERAVVVLNLLVKISVRQWIAKEPSQCYAIACHLLDRLKTENIPSGSPILLDLIGFVLSKLAIESGFQPACEHLSHFLDDLVAFEPVLMGSICSTQAMYSAAELLGVIDPGREEDLKRTRKRTIDWFSKVLDRTSQAMGGIQEKWRNSEVLSDGQQKLYVAAARLAEAVSFRVWTSIAPLNQDHTEPAIEAAQRRFMQEGATLLTQLVSLRDARIVKNDMGLLLALVRFSPSRIIQLVGQLFAVPDGLLWDFHQDSLIWGDVSEFVRKTLADYGEVLQDATIARELILALDAFARAGEPEALSLLYEIEFMWH